MYIYDRFILLYKKLTQNCKAIILQKIKLIKKKKKKVFPNDTSFSCLQPTRLHGDIKPQSPALDILKLEPLRGVQ